MIKMLFVIFAGLFVVYENAVADSIILDAQIARLEQRRDELKQKIEACEQSTKKHKIAGVATVAAAGVGVVANVKLYQKVSSIKSGGTSSTSGGGKGSSPQENLSPEQKNDRFCKTALNKLGDIEKVRKLDSCKDFNG